MAMTRSISKTLTHLMMTSENTTTTSQKVGTRMTPAEIELLERTATATGHSVSSYIRTATKKQMLEDVLDLTGHHSTFKSMKDKDNAINSLVAMVSGEKETKDDSIQYFLCSNINKNIELNRRLKALPGEHANELIDRAVSITKIELDELHRHSLPGSSFEDELFIRLMNELESTEQFNDPVFQAYLDAELQEQEIKEKCEATLMSLREGKTIQQIQEQG